MHIVVAVGSEHVHHRVPVLRKDRQGMEKTMAEANVEESTQVDFFL